jgi:hypothetical protein
VFGDEAPEPPHPGQKVIQAIFAILLLAGGIYGLKTGHLILASTLRPGHPVDGLAAYLIAVSFLCLSVLLLMTLKDWSDRMLQKLIAKILFVLFLVMFTIGVFI